MTQPVASETIEYDRYVDGLRNSHGLLLTALQYMVAWAERHGLTRADLITGGQAEVPVITIARDAITNAQALNGSPVATKTIVVRVEGGMVADVDGIPAGYELRVEDYDGDDTAHRHGMRRRSAP